MDIYAKTYSTLHNNTIDTTIKIIFIQSFSHSYTETLKRRSKKNNSSISGSYQLAKQMNTRSAVDAHRSDCLAGSPYAESGIVFIFLSFTIHFVSSEVYLNVFDNISRNCTYLYTVSYKSV